MLFSISSFSIFFNKFIWKKPFHFTLKHIDYIELSSKNAVYGLCIRVWWMTINNIIFNNIKKIWERFNSLFSGCCCWRIYALVADVDSLSVKHLLLNDYCSMKKKVLSFDGLKNILMVFNPLEIFMLERPKKMFFQCSPTAQNTCI